MRNLQIQICKLTKTPSLASTIVLDHLSLLLALSSMSSIQGYGWRVVFFSKLLSNDDGIKFARLNQLP